MRIRIQTEVEVSYEKPAIADYGDLVELTALQQDGNFTDAAFPDHTPRGDLTFS
jgi:hypothetical protein